MVVPESRAELADLVRGSKHLTLCGLNTQRDWRVKNDREPSPISMRRFTRVLEYSPADQVIVAEAGIALADLEAALAEAGQCLPLATFTPQETLGGAMAMGMPHALEARYGSWRDWVLGVRMLRDDGTDVWAGSKVVKSVAGYDLHRLQVGARGVFGILLEVALRVTPSASCPVRPAVPERAAEITAIVRVWPSQFTTLRSALSSAIIAEDETTATLWLSRKPNPAELPEKAILWERDPKRPFLNAPVEVARRMKQALDPGYKFNPHEFGHQVLGEREVELETA